jgi:hypothetical protein
LELLSLLQIFSDGGFQQLLTQWRKKIICLEKRWNV